MSVREILARRRSEQQELLNRARDFADSLGPELGVRAVCVFGSVARGDFNVWSDIDVLVVAEHLPENPLRRPELLEPFPPRVQPIAWTVEEWLDQRVRNNPMVVEALARGVWLVGSAPDLAMH